MRAVSAADSVPLAIRRTREFLFSQFRWGTYLKLGLVAILTECSMTNFQSSSQRNHSSARGPLMNTPFDITAGRVAVTVAALLLVLVICSAVFYLLTRLRFAFFHCLVHNTREIQPGWEIYREPAARFFWLNLVVGFCFLLLAALVALPFAGGLWRVFRDTPPGGHPDVVLLLSLVLPLIPLFFLLILAGITIDLILRDWMLPHFALENASAGEAWHSVWASIKAEKKQFFVYVLLRVVLPTIAMAGLFMVLMIPGLMVAGSIGAIVYAIHTAFAASTGGAALAGNLLQGFFGVLAFAFMLLAGICLGGPVSTGTREFALTFYGGRYQALGDMLDRAGSATTA